MCFNQPDRETQTLFVKIILNDKTFMKMYLKCFGKSVRIITILKMIGRRVVINLPTAFSIDKILFSTLLNNNNLFLSRNRKLARLYTSLLASVYSFAALLLLSLNAIDIDFRALAIIKLSNRVCSVNVVKFN